ncbi:MAG: hypothetical protein EB119_07705, partial [Synechococcaceae bacterium WBB_34_004]|nr:hypothetical protein [Synechococcaceae bacterium WBB_34_004]
MVGINNPNPIFELDIVGNINFSGSMYNNNNIIVSSQWQNLNNNDMFYDQGNIGIKTYIINHTLEVGGDVGISENLYVGSSSARALVIDTVNNFVGINKAVPNYQLDINGKFFSNDDLNINNKIFLYKNGNTNILGNLNINDNFIDIDLEDPPTNIPVTFWQIYNHNPGRCEEEPLVATVYSVKGVLPFPLGSMRFSSSGVSLNIMKTRDLESYPGGIIKLFEVDVCYTYFVDIISVDDEGVDMIESYFNKIAPKKAEITIEGSSDKFFFTIEDWFIDEHSTPSVSVNKNLPPSKAETASIYFPANEFGSGAIAKLNTTVGPSGYIICDSATLVQNNKYTVEPMGYIRSVGYDIPTRIGSVDNNFIGSGTFLSGAGDKLLDNNNEFYRVGTNMLIKEGGGIKPISNTLIRPALNYSNETLNYYLSPPDNMFLYTKTDQYGRRYHNNIIIKGIALGTDYPTNNIGASVLLDPKIDQINLTRGYYEDPEILSGYRLGITLDYMLNPNNSGVLKNNIIPDAFRISNIMSNIQPSGELIPYTVDRLFSDRIIQINNKIFIDTMNYNIVKDEQNKPQQTQSEFDFYILNNDIIKLRPFIDTHLFAARSQYEGPMFSSSDPLTAGLRDGKLHPLGFLVGSLQLPQGSLINHVTYNYIIQFYRSFYLFNQCWGDNSDAIIEYYENNNITFTSGNSITITAQGSGTPVPQIKFIRPKPIYVSVDNYTQDSDYNTNPQDIPYLSIHSGHLQYREINVLPSYFSEFIFKVKNTNIDISNMFKPT